MSLLQEGILKQLIKISEDEKQIFYKNYYRSRNFSYPEEKVQAETFLKLIINYGYKPERIKLYEPVKMGSDTREADIIVYNDDACEEPHILVECKKQDVSEQEFQQAIEQAYSYAYALPNEIKYVWVTSGVKDEYFEVDKKRKTRITQPDIPQFGVTKLENYKYVYDAKHLEQKQGVQKFKDLEIVEEKTLTSRFKQAHDALWAGGQLNPSEAFDELDKLIFCKIWDERKDRLPGEPYDFQIITVNKEEVKNWNKLGAEELRRAIRDLENRRLADRINNLYEEGRKKDPEVFRDNIRLTPEKIRTVVGYLQDINMGDTDLDAKGRAFETFMDAFFRGNFGQYFTPRPIVNFAVEVLPITNSSLVLDTSCGSGGFLLYALNKIRKQANALYPKHKTDIKQNEKHKRFWHDFAQHNLYGIEINEQISRAAKMNMIIHDDGHTNVITADGLLLENDIERFTQNKGFKYGRFDFIITNPPFGSEVRKSEKNYLGIYEFGKKEPDWLDTKGRNVIEKRERQSTEVMFIEQCHNFLRPGGYVAIVLPDGILTNSSLQYVRDGIEDKFRIVAVVSMPQTAFAATGAGVKSSILFLRKHTPEHSEKLRNQKASIQIRLKQSFDYYKKVEAWEKEKANKIKTMDGFENPFPTLTVKEVKDSAEFKEWKEEVSAYYADLINDLKEQLQEAYLKAKQTELPDYPIFMAIAEDIGYDATGKSTGKGDGDFEIIREELRNFINQIETSKI